MTVIWALICIFWLAVLVFLSGYVHGRAVEQTRVIQAMADYYNAPARLLYTRLERAYGIKWEWNGGGYRGGGYRDEDEKD